MSDEARQLLQRLAGLLGEPEAATDVSVRESLDLINRRLDSIEKRIAPRAIPGAGPTGPGHPSFRKFNVDDIAADEAPSVAGIEKACPYEPTSKPCDHCSMCSSLGF